MNGTSQRISVLCSIEAYRKFLSKMKIFNIVKSAKPEPCKPLFTVRKARELMRKGHKREAEGLLRQNLKEYPTFRITIFQLINLYSRLRDVGSAEMMFEYAKTRNIADNKIESEMIETYSRNGMQDKAVKLFMETTRGGTSIPWSVNSLLRNYLKRSKPEEAREIFDAAVSAGSADANTFSLMVMIYKNARNCEKALDVFNLAVKLGLADHYATSNLLQVLKKDKKVKEAEDVYRMSVERGIADNYIHSIMIDLYVKGGEVSKAREIFNTVFGEDVPVQAYSSMMYGYIILGDMNKAKKLLTDAMDKGIADANLFTLMVRAFDQQRSVNVARWYFNTAVKKGMADPRLYTSMVRVYMQAGEHKNAIRTFRSAVNQGMVEPALFSRAIKAIRSSSDKEYFFRSITEACYCGKLNERDILMLFNHLYEDRRFIDLLRIGNALPEDLQRSPAIMLKKADALRKRGIDRDAIKLLDSLLSRDDIESGIRFKAMTIKGFVLKDSGRKEEALRLFIRLDKETPKESQNNLRLACGLVFCWEELSFHRMLGVRDIERLQKRLEHSKGRHSSNLQNDIKKALMAIERSGMLDSESGEFAYKMPD